MSEPIRLAKRVAELAGCSRREADQYIQGGWVTVDGEVIDAPQHPITSQTVLIDPEADLEAAEPATLLLHKPAGIDIRRIAETGDPREPYRRRRPRRACAEAAFRAPDPA